MDINSVSNVFHIPRSESVDSPREAKPEGKHAESRGDRDVSISPMGKMMANRPSFSEEGKQQMQAFREQVATAVDSGDFNAASLASQAPDEFQAFASENGIDMAEFLTQLSSRAGHARESSTQASASSSLKGAESASVYEVSNSYQKISDIIDQLGGNQQPDGIV